MTSIAIWQCFPIIGEVYDQHGDFPLEKKTYFNMLRDLISGGPIGGRSTLTELQEGMQECLQYLQNIGWNETVCEEFSMMVDMIADHVYGEVPVCNSASEEEVADEDAEYEAETGEPRATEESEAEPGAMPDAEDTEAEEYEGEAEHAEVNGPCETKKGIEVGNASPIPTNVLNDPYMVWLAGYITAKVFEGRQTSE